MCVTTITLATFCSSVVSREYFSRGRQTFSTLSEITLHESLSFVIGTFIVKRTLRFYHKIPQVLKPCQTNCNIIQHCWMMLNSVERGLDSRVWDQNLPRILRKQIRAILICPRNGVKPIDLGHVGPSSRFSWSYSFTYSFALSHSWNLTLIRQRARQI